MGKQAAQRKNKIKSIKLEGRWKGEGKRETEARFTVRRPSPPLLFQGEMGLRRESERTYERGKNYARLVNFSASPFCRDSLC